MKYREDIYEFHSHRFKKRNFGDEALIDRSRTTAELRLHKPRIEEIVFVHDAPWEGDGCNSYSIVKIGDSYRAYYLAWEMMNKECTAHLSEKEHFVCCLESADDIHWTFQERLEADRYRYVRYA